MPDEPKHVRLSVNLSEVAAAELQRVAAQQDVSATVVVNKALRAYHLLWNAQNDGKTLVLRDKHTTSEVELL